MDFDAPIYSLQNARLQFGERPLFTGLDLYLNKGRKYCLVGRNGSGKSTLLKVIAGETAPDDGKSFLQPGTVVSYMAQDDDLSRFSTLRDAVLSGLGGDGTDLSYKADILIERLEINAGADPDRKSVGRERVC